MCKGDGHNVRDCPKQICQGCGERDHHMTKCRKIDNAVMTFDMPGRTSTGDDSSVCSKTELEAYITLEIKTGEYLFSKLEEGEIR